MILRKFRDDFDDKNGRVDGVEFQRDFRATGGVGVDCKRERCLDAHAIRAEIRSENDGAPKIWNAIEMVAKNGFTEF